eukprot:1160372-Pelagomonas_calceolata.AAC.6
MAPLRGHALRRMPPCSVSSKSSSKEVQAGMQQQEQKMELRAKAERANSPAVRCVGRLCSDPATHPAPAPKRLVGRPRASTHVQAPTAEPERLLVLVQLSAHAERVTFTSSSLPAFQQMLRRCKAREAAAKAAEQQVWVRYQCN